MTSNRWRPIGVAVLALVAVVVALALTGRGTSDQPGAAAPGATQTPGAGASTSPTGDGAASATSKPPGVTRTGSGASGLPDGFPLAQVPVIAGTIVGGSKGAAGDPYDYTVIVEVRGRTVATVMQGITEQLTTQGFTAEPSPATDAFAAATFRGAAYDVPVNVVRDQGKTTVTYLVIRK